MLTQMDCDAYFKVASQLQAFMRGHMPKAHKGLVPCCEASHACKPCSTEAEAAIMHVAVWKGTICCTRWEACRFSDRYEALNQTARCDLAALGRLSSRLACCLSIPA